MTISFKKKKAPTSNELISLDIRLEKVKRLHTKINQFKLKVKEFKYEKEEGNPDDVLKNI